MTILPTLALRSFVGFDNLFNELESISNQKQSSFPFLPILCRAVSPLLSYETL